MRTIFSFLIVLFFPLTINITTSDAQDFPKWHLPEGAIARLGKGTIEDLAYSPDGSRLAVASGTGIWIYDAATGEELTLLTELSHSDNGRRVSSVAFNPDGNTIAGGGHDRVRIWDVATGTRINTIEGSSFRTISSVSYSPDGRTLAAAIQSSSVHLWDVATGTLKNRLSEHTHTVDDVAFSPDGSTLASASGNLDSTVRIWDASTGTPIHTLEHDGVESIAYSPDGRRIASGGSGEVYLWDVAAGTLVKKFGARDYVKSVAYSPDGRTLATASGVTREVHLWDATTGTLKNTLKHPHEVYSIVFSPDGHTITSGSLDGIVRIWDASTGSLKNAITGHGDEVYGVAFSPDSRTLASASKDRTVRLWDTATGKLRNALTGHEGFVNSVAYSPDGRTIITGSNDRKIGIWDAATGALSRTLTRGGGIVSSVAYSPDGNTFASVDREGVSIWNAATNTLRYTIKNTIWPDFITYSTTTYSPDGRTIATGSQDGALRIWNVETGHLINTLKEPNFDDSVGSIAYSRDGNTLAAGVSTSARASTIRIWDLTIGSLIYIIEHYNSPWSVAYSPDGRTIATGGFNVHLYDAATGSIKDTLTGHSSDVRSVSFSLDGTMLASGGSKDGTVLLWELIPAPPEPETIAEDVNADGVVNIQDLVLVAADLGETGENAADVNSDGVVNIQDLVLVAAALGQTTAAPSIRASVLEQLNANDLRQWIQAAQQENLTDLTFQRGVQVLEQLLSVLAPKETALLANYPNPFNPETWIPYHLTKPADVTLTIYAADGAVVRTLALGHQPVGFYEDKSRAAYWDGRNNVGEPVASGLYFYTLTAGDFTATRKMLIRK